MKKALLICTTAKFHTLFNTNNIAILKKLGFEVYAAANFEDKNNLKNNEAIRLQLVEMGVKPVNVPFVRRSLIKNIKTISALRALIKEGFDIIHVHSETAGLIFAVSSLFLKKKGAYIYTPHGTSFYKGSSLLSWALYSPIERWIASKMDLNVSMNDEEIAFFDSCSKEKSRYVHGIGIDREKILSCQKYDRHKIKELFGIPEEAILAVSVGELCKRKNHQVVIKALSKLKDKNIYYVICGTGSLEKQLKKMCSSYGLQNVVFAGYRNDVYSIVSSCDFFVFPSIYEGLPVSVMEAMVLSKPVICSDIRGSRELIEDGKGGYLVENNVDDYVEAINEIISSKKIASEFGDYNFLKIKNYTSEVVKKELAEIYLESDFYER